MSNTNEISRNFREIPEKSTLQGANWAFPYRAVGGVESFFANFANFFSDFLIRRMEERREEVEYVWSCAYSVQTCASVLGYSPAVLFALRFCTATFDFAA
eukprot:1887867-Rhodomonas_salina.1